MRKMGSSAVRTQLEDGPMGAPLPFSRCRSFGFAFIGVDFFLVSFLLSVGSSLSGVAFLGVAFWAIFLVARPVGVGWLCCVRFEGRK